MNLFESAPKPDPAAKLPQAGKSAGAVAVKGTAEAVSGDSSGRVLGQPLYLVRQQVNYPSESRSAGEQGVVLLRITVNAGGRPTAVNVTKTSGLSRLDRAAVEGGWRCRVSNAFDGAQFEAPSGSACRIAKSRREFDASPAKALHLLTSAAPAFRAHVLLQPGKPEWSGGVKLAAVASTQTPLIEKRAAGSTSPKRKSAFCGCI
jgi:TonB family protein